MFTNKKRKIACFLSAVALVSAMGLSVCAAGDDADLIPGPGVSGEVGVRLVDEGTCGDQLTWELYASGELCLYGTGAMYDGTVGWAEYRDQILCVDLPGTVTKLADDAFANCPNLSSVLWFGNVTGWYGLDMGSGNDHLSDLVSFPNKKGWSLEAGKWYFYINHVPAKNRWMQDSIGWVYLGADGAMVTNSWLTDSNGLCYVGADGYCLTNCWKEHTQGWVYFNDQGSMTKETWLQRDGKWCYLGTDGFAATGDREIDGHVYPFDENGFLLEIFTVQFVDWDGTVLANADYKYGDAVAQPQVPDRAADGQYTYTFAGWDLAVTPAYDHATYVATYTATPLPEVSGNAITRQPQAVSAETGDVVTFHVEAQGEVVAYRWEYRKIYKWFNTSMEGYTTDTLTVPATGARNGYDYRCLVTFADGTQIYSEPAELTVQTYITNVVGPNDQTVVLGYKGQFTASASGEGLKYQWQYKRPDGEKWFETSMEGATRQTVYVESSTARDGYEYRCRITDVAGVVTYTEPATMRVLSFKSHPVETFAATGDTVTFTVTTSVDSGFTYQWQYRRSATGNWSNTSLSGYNTATLNVPVKGKNGYEYRCVLTGSKNSKIESKVATLHVGDPVVITAQPQSVTVTAAENAVFTVTATNVYAYQWRYSKNGTTWYTTSAEGNQTATLTVAAKGKNGYQYRCHIYGLDGTETITQPVTLTLGS